MPIRVLHIATYMGRGGLETMIMNYYRHIDRERVQFDFLVHRDFKADYEDEILSLGGRIFRLPPLNPFDARYYRALDAFFEQHSYDIVHSHLDCLSAYPLKIAKKHGCKIRISHAHSKDQDKNLKYLIKVFSKRLIPHYATHLFACGQDAGEWMFHSNKFTVINNAIEAKKFVFQPDTSLQMKQTFHLEHQWVIGHVGRFNPPKNHEFLVHIFAELIKKDSSAHLVLVGTGSSQSQIEDLVQKLDIGQKVTFLGNRDDIPQLLQMMDVFVFPSLHEGLGIAAVEAQAAGIPCIVSNQVPRECQLTDIIEFMSLKMSPQQWAEKIYTYRHFLKQDQYNAISAAGYDIESNVAYLQNFYTNGAF